MCVLVSHTLAHTHTQTHTHTHTEYKMIVLFRHAGTPRILRARARVCCVVKEREMKRERESPCININARKDTGRRCTWLKQWEVC